MDTTLVQCLTLCSARMYTRNIMQRSKRRHPEWSGAPFDDVVCASGLPALCAWSDGPRCCTADQKLEQCAVDANRARKVHEAHALTGARLAEAVS